MLCDEASDCGGVRQIDEMPSVRNRLLSLHTAKRDDVVAPAVNLMHRTVEPGGVPPTQDHGSLPSELDNRHVPAHVQKQPMLFVANPFHSGNHSACRFGDAPDDRIGHRLGGVKDQPIPL